MTFVFHLLKEHNVELTVVAYCFLILLIPTMYLIPSGMGAIITTMVEGGYTNPAIWDSNNFIFIARALNVVWYLVLVLIAWFASNAIQMVYLSYLQIRYGE